MCCHRRDPLSSAHWLSTASGPGQAFVGSNVDIKAGALLGLSANLRVENLSFESVLYWSGLWTRQLQHPIVDRPGKR